MLRRMKFERSQVITRTSIRQISKFEMHLMYLETACGPNANLKFQENTKKTTTHATRSFICFSVSLSNLNRISRKQ